MHYEIKSVMMNRQNEKNTERIITMDCNKVGKLISDLRKEQKMTQKQLADALNISDKAISKWERGVSHS